jgi:gliding motility-associated-like protein
MNYRSRLAFAILYCFTVSLAGAQNLVPNPSFEQYNNCPSTLVSMPYSGNYSFFPTIQHWTTPVRYTTPDFLHDCAQASSGLKVPNTTFGYQLAKSGAAYGGIIAFQGQYTGGTLTSDYREYLQTQLLQPMVAGRQYCVSFFVSPTISANFNYNYVAVDEIGINFSVNRPVDTINRTLSLPYHIKNTPGNFLTDTSKWYKIHGTYTATGGEQWLTLGTFFNGAAPVFVPVHPGNPNPAIMYWNYFFVDDVSVTELTSADTVISTWDTVVCSTNGLSKVLEATPGAASYLWQDGTNGSQFSATDTGLYWCTALMDCGQAMDTFRIIHGPSRKLNIGRDTINCLGLPVTVGSSQPFNTYLWSSGATSPVITVAQSGNYVLTVTDTCGMQSDTVSVIIQPPTPAPVVRDTAICQYVNMPVLQVQGSGLTWYYPGLPNGLQTQPYIETGITGVQTFYVSQTIGKCESPKVPVNVTIKYKPVVEIGDYYMICTGGDTIIGQYLDNVSYLWNTGEKTCCIHPRKTGTYEVTVQNDCGTSTDTAFVEVFPCDECLFVPTAFTPNGDGRNDQFAPVIKCPVYNYRLRVYNRWGELVFTTNNPGEGWNGRYKGGTADLGVYMYIMEYNSANTKSRKLHQGNVTLIR